MNEELDELASAYVDGEASPTEVARVESDSDLQAIVAEFEAVKAPPVVQTNAFKTAHLETAMAAFDNATTAAEDEVRTPLSAGSQASNVVSLPRRRVSGSPRWLIGSAAAVMVLGGLGIAIRQFPNSSRQEDAATAAGTADDAGDAFETSSRDADEGGSISAQASQLGPTSTTAPTADDAQSSDDDAMDEEMEEEMEEDLDSEEAGEETRIRDLPPAEAGRTPAEILASQAPATINEIIRPPEASHCPQSTELVARDLGGVHAGFLTLMYGEQSAELHLSQLDGARPGLILATDTCEVLIVDV